MALKEAEDVVDLSTPGEDRFAAKTNECRHHMGRREKNCTESYSMEEPCWEQVECSQVEWKAEKNQILATP